MDAAAIWKAAAEAGGNVPQCKTDSAPAAAGYAWNVCLRGPERPRPGVPFGRFPASALKVAGESGYLVTNWLTLVIELPNDKLVVSQALKPDEVDQPGRCALAWDSMDLGSVPKETYWGSSSTDWGACMYENLVPGWNIGAQTWGANGWALLPADRHPGTSPNIAYVDGSVRADATRRIKKSDIPKIAGRMPSGSEMHLTSWDDYNSTFGTSGYMLPKRQIITDWP